MKSLINFPKFPADSFSSKYVGIEYIDCGRDLGGFDCWGLNWWVYKDDFGVSVLDNLVGFRPDMSDAEFVKHSTRLIRDQSLDWTEVKIPVRGATALIRKNGQPVHVGICTGGGFRGRGDILHADHGVGSVVLEPVDRLSDLIQGYYVPPGLTVRADIMGAK